MTNKEAYIILNMVSGVGPIKLSKLCESFGSPAEALSAKKKALESVEGIGTILAEEISKWKENIDIDAELKLCEKAGVSIITRDDESYPPRLLELPDAPLCIYLRGSAEILSKKSIAIVGSRRITNYGRRMSEYLASSAAYAGWPVISGLAFGTDAIAHKAALDAGGETVAVLGGGLARIFPQDHLPLAKRIVESGSAVISEFPMEFPPNKRSFPMRNRIISGLSLGTVVIEAGSSSGALITAKFALEHGRLVFAVPGEADNPQARGCNKLIKDGAKLVENFDDILEEFDFLPGMRNHLKTESEESGNTENISHNDLKLSEDELKITTLLEEGEKSADSLSVESGIDAGKLLSLLSMMEMKKLITQNPGKIFSIRRQL
jgi:DNA processing protein